MKHSVRDILRVEGVEKKAGRIDRFTALWICRPFQHVGARLPAKIVAERMASPKCL
jgi:hypothetical protein